MSQLQSKRIIFLFSQTVLVIFTNLQIKNNYDSKLLHQYVKYNVFVSLISYFQKLRQEKHRTNSKIWNCEKINVIDFISGALVRSY